MAGFVAGLMKALERLIGVGFMALTGLTLAQVFCRYLLSFSLTWSHEVIILILTWAVWLAIPVGLHRGEHLVVTFVLDHLRPGARRWFARSHELLGIFFFLLVLVLSLPVAEAFEGMSMTALPLPTTVRYYAATVGSLLSALVLLDHLLARRRAPR
jgi:TRAP-type C4-dicarboxylate transport system permease small subunit